jgi:pyridinium-3,5-biscarboxylic acid mononucleotide sulfurtransferase
MTSSFPSGRLDAAAVRARIAEGGRAVVALSGGVDSAVVAALAQEALRADAVAVTLSGPAVARHEVARATEVAGAIGILHVVLEADPLANAQYRANPTNRCYFCRSVEAARLTEFGARWGARQYLDGIQLDDLTDDRPGVRAMEEAGFAHPLVAARWAKSDVRAWARQQGLPNAETPSDACLASRVAHGEPIDAPLLRRIERAEGALLARGFRRVRVRVRSGAARVEVDPEEVSRLSASPMAEEVVAELRDLGFDPVTLDPHGYGAARLVAGGGR